jgi:hypothetical protein
MIGTIERPGIATKALSAAMAAVDHMRAVGWRGRRAMRQFLVAGGERKNRRWRNGPAKTIRALQRCVQLSAEFKIVERDETAIRKIKVKADNQYGTDSVADVPLVFHTRLPAKIKTKLDFRCGDKRFTAEAVTPMPTTEALDAIRKHGKRFDRVELWWVPNDLLVERIEPDPIIVGVVEVPGNRAMHFELHRWIDESVEVGWWSREGY